MPLQLISIIQFIFIFQVTFGAILVWKNPRYRGLSYLLLLSAISMAFNLLEDIAGTREFYLVTPIFLLAKGPFFYLFVFQLVYPEKPSHRKYLWHIIPMLIVLPLTNWPRLVIALGSLSQLIYAFISIRLILNYRKASYSNRADAASLQLYWVVNVLAGFVVVGMLDLIRLNVQPHIPLTLNLIGQLVDNTAFLLLFSYLIVKAAHNPNLFDDLSVYDSLQKQGPPVDTAESDSVTEQIYHSLDGLIKQKSLHHKPRLALNDLAIETGLNLRDISRAFNQSGGLSFCDYINKLRIDDVKQALSENHSSTQNLLDLAFTFGFNSKSTFNAVFKRETGQTPTQYLKSLRR